MLYNPIKIHKTSINSHSSLLKLLLTSHQLYILTLLKTHKTAIKNPYNLHRLAINPQPLAGVLREARGSAPACGHLHFLIVRHGGLFHHSA